MEKITQQAVAELLDPAVAGPAITIYMPMHRSAAPPHMAEDQIRFKNLIYTASRQLGSQDGHAKLTKALFRQLETDFANPKFWEGQAAGLLICLRPGGLRMFQLPIDTEEYVAVDSAFHLTPILGLLHDAPEFYVLVVAQHNPQFYRGDMYGLHDTSVDLPQNLEATLQLDENDQKGVHTQSATGSSVRTVAFNGRGGFRDPTEDERARFFRILDGIVTKSADRRLPLILAGTDDEVAIYRSLSKYPRILDQIVAANRGSMKPNDIFAQAYAIARDELVVPMHRQAIEAYNRLSGRNPDRAIRDQSAIEKAAEQGRVDTLLLGMSRLTTDTVRDNKQPVERITFPTGKVKDAVHKLALAVQRMSGGNIIILDEGQMPGNSRVAAVLRY